jgi:hypothetical protein
LRGLLLGFRFLDNGLGLLADFGPAAAKRVHENGLDDEADIGFAGVVGAKLRALVGIEAAFEERAEDGGLDAGPVELGGEGEDGEIVAGEVVGFVV